MPLQDLPAYFVADASAHYVSNICNIERAVMTDESNDPSCATGPAVPNQVDQPGTQLMPPPEITDSNRDKRRSPGRMPLFRS
jgi:hypothetical protein